MGSNGPIAEHVFRALTSVAKTECPLLFVGEHGAGKRTTATEIHALSFRSREPFHELRCRDLDTDGLHAALEKTGTIYFSEVTELRPALQDVLVEEYFHSGQLWKCRVLFGSSRDLQEEVKAGQMREDFYDLVSTLTVRISPLRLRRPEILNISDVLLSEYAKQFGRPKPALGDKIIAFLLDHTWPNNFPELETAIKTIVAIDDQAVSLAALKAAAGSSRHNGDQGGLSLKKATRQASLLVERQMISRVLASTGGNRKRAASELGISYKALLYKVKQFRMATPIDRGSFGAAL